jgi:hypothetical protein
MNESQTTQSPNGIHRPSSLQVAHSYKAILQMHAQLVVSAFHNVDAVVMIGAAFTYFDTSIFPLLVVANALVTNFPSWRRSLFRHGVAVYSLIGRCFANNYPLIDSKTNFSYGLFVTHGNLVLHPDCPTDVFQHIVLLKQAEGNENVDDVFVGSMRTLLMGKMIYE